MGPRGPKTSFWAKNFFLKFFRFLRVRGGGVANRGAGRARAKKNREFGPRARIAIALSIGTSREILEFHNDASAATLWGPAPRGTPGRGGGEGGGSISASGFSHLATLEVSLR